MNVRQRIAFKLALIAVIIALVVSAFFGSMQIIADYRNERARATEVVTQLLNAYEPAAQRAIHNLDERLAHEVASGILTYDFLVEAHIVDELGTVLGSAQREPDANQSNWLLRQLSARFISEQRNIPIVSDDQAGQLHIRIDLHRALQPVVDRAGSTLAIAALRSVILVLLFFVAYHWLVTRPLVSLSQQFRNLDPREAHGIKLTVANRHKDDELGELASSAQRFVTTVQELLRDRKETERELLHSSERIRYMAYHDSLTGLSNRNHMHDYLEEVLENARDNGRFSALVFVDLDNFKTINDSLGHPAGDHVLKTVARRLQQQAGQQDNVARMGGDEFVLCLTNLSGNQKGALQQAENRSVFIRQALSMPIWYGSHRLTVTASVGIALFPDGHLRASDLLRNADIAMYAAKTQGKNTHELFQQHMTDEASRRMLLENDLRTALDEKQFFLVFQPQVDMQTNRIIGVEALIRWQHPTKGVVSPMVFIPVLETTGMIKPVGEWVFEHACAAIRRWRDVGLWTDDMRMGINVSASQFSDQHLVDSLHSAIRQADIPAQCIDLEITESMLIESVDETISRMHEIRALGVSFSIDDFGTGYSSLVYLKRLPVDMIKIDQGFIRDIESDPNDAAIVETIIAIARHLGLKTIAEGVETLSHLNFLRSHGCMHYQGYHFSPPVSDDAMKQLLTQDMTTRVD